MRWTKKRPTTPGWYWYKSAEGPGTCFLVDHPSGMAVLEVIQDQYELFCRHPDRDLSLDELYGQWSDTVIALPRKETS